MQTIILTASIWQGQLRFPDLLRSSKRLPFPVSRKEDFLKNPVDQIKPIMNYKTMILATFSLHKQFCQKEILEQTAKLSLASPRKGYTKFLFSLQNAFIRHMKTVQ